MQFFFFSGCSYIDIILHLNENTVTGFLVFFNKKNNANHFAASTKGPVWLN